MTSADGITFAGDYLVLAMGTEPNFFHTPGAEEHAFPLYSLDDAERLRSRLLTVFEDAYRNPELVDQGALNFVIVGAGATGVETAGALADAINRIIPAAGRRRRDRCWHESTWSTRPRSCSRPSPTAPTSTHGRCSSSGACKLELGMKVDRDRGRPRRRSPTVARS